MTVVNGFWRETIFLWNKKKLPSEFFEKQNIWLYRGNMYRLLVEPCDIANHYGLKSMSGVGHYLAGNRPGRYEFLEELWLRRKGERPLSSIQFALTEQNLDPHGRTMQSSKTPRKAPSGNTTEVDISTTEFLTEDCSEFTRQWMQDARLQELNNRQACNKVSTPLTDHLWAHGTEDNETCRTCCKRGEASCARHIWQAPNVLVIDVQRNLTSIIKEEGVVIFPEGLDLSHWTSLLRRQRTTLRGMSCPLMGTCRCHQLH
ncbi:hypothetical protein WJX82_002300 [Trebouxia sp. C0006]